MDMLVKICALAVISAFVYLFVLQLGKSGAVSFAVRLAGVVLVGGGIVVLAEPVVMEMLSLAQINMYTSEYAIVVIKATGIAILSHLCADACRDMGNNSVANGVVLAAKLEIVFLCIPMIKKIIGYAEEIMNMR